MSDRNSLYLDRSIHTLAFYLALITNEKDLHQEMKYLKLPREQWPEMPKYPSRGRAVQLQSEAGRVVTLVLMPEHKELSGIQIASYLAHEAVHVWQFHLDEIGDRESHSKEFEAYGIQHIFETLMTAYAKKTGRL